MEDRLEAGKTGLVQSRLGDRETDGFNSYLRAGTHSLWWLKEGRKEGRWEEGVKNDD